MPDAFKNATVLPKKENGKARPARESQETCQFNVFVKTFAK
jgi:hypothetical protein